MGQNLTADVQKNHRVTALFVVHQVIAQSDSHLQHLCIIYSCSTFKKQERSNSNTDDDNLIL